MSNLSILNTAIRVHNNLFSLNDLHKVGGNQSKHQPTFFIRLDSTKELVAEIQQEDPNIQPIISKNGIGTYACEEIALAYAMWISPKFHLVVLRAFIAMHKQQAQPQQIALPEPEKKYTVELTEDEILDLAWAWFAFLRGIHTFRHIYPAFEKLGSNMSGAIYGQGFEYCQTARQAHKVISRLTQDLEYHFDSNHRVLKHVRNFDPTFKKSIL